MWRTRMATRSSWYRREPPGQSDIFQTCQENTRTAGVRSGCSQTRSNMSSSSSESDRFGAIQVRGARENNLQNISVDIPRRRITVFTGVSGSGKSSLVFDTIAAESQRLLNETFP